MRVGLFVFAFAMWTLPAQAIIIDVDVLKISSNIQPDVCAPCGFGVITINGVRDSVDWWGSGGWAHEYYDNAVSAGVPIFDASVGWDAFDAWLALNPNGIAWIGDTVGEWTTEVFNSGSLESSFSDILDLSIGYWRTAELEHGDYHDASFTILDVRDEGPAPTPVPEPGSLSLFLIAAVGAALSRIWTRYIAAEWHKELLRSLN